METSAKCILRNKLNGKYIGKGFDHTLRRMELTKSIKSAMKFEDEANASEWLLNSIYAPSETESYEYVSIVITYETEGEYRERMPDLQAGVERGKKTPA